MKTLPVVALLFIVASTFSQTGKITMTNQPESPEDQAIFLYEAPEGLLMPEDVQANISCSDIQIKSIPLEKKGLGYEFSMKLPANSKVLFLSVTDKKLNVIDNNSGNLNTVSFRHFGSHLGVHQVTGIIFDNH